MTKLVEVELGNDGPERCVELGLTAADAGEKDQNTSRIIHKLSTTYVIHLWIPGGRPVGKKDTDSLNQDEALQIWTLIAHALNKYYVVEPLATCAGGAEACDRSKWMNVYKQQVCFPNAARKPYHLRFLLKSQPGVQPTEIDIDLPQHQVVPIDVEKMLSVSGVTLPIPLQ